MSDSKPNLDPAKLVESSPQVPNDQPATPMSQTTSTSTLTELSPQQALAEFVKNPVGFIQSIIQQEAHLHLADLKEEAELRGAINAFRKANPEFSRFEPFIMQEVVSLIQNDPDGIIDSWEILLEKGLKNFRQKFRDTVTGKSSDLNENTSEAPYMETATNRKMPEPPPSFTREQIAGMSMPDFLKNEAAINEAMKAKRIR